MNSVYFPKNMQIVEVARKMLKPSKPNGGWGDPRDHQLCRLNTRPFGVLTNESGGKKRKIIPVSLLNDILSIRIPDN